MPPGAKQIIDKMPASAQQIHTETYVYCLDIDNKHIHCYNEAYWHYMKQNEKDERQNH